MASSTLTFKDQNGNPVWGLATRLSRGSWDTSKAEDERYPDRSGKTTFIDVKDDFASPLNDSGDGHTIHVNYNEGLNSDWKNYETVSKHFSDIEDANQLNEVIVIKHTGVPVPEPTACPVDHNREQFTNWFNKNKVGIIVSHENMHAMLAAMEKCGMVWQNQKVYSEDKWRPRIFQPPLNLPNYDSDWFVDCGDFGEPWKLTFRY